MPCSVWSQQARDLPYFHLRITIFNFFQVLQTYRVESDGEVEDEREEDGPQHVGRRLGDQLGQKVGRPMYTCEGVMNIRIERRRIRNQARGMLYEDTSKGDAY